MCRPMAATTVRTESVQIATDESRPGSEFRARRTVKDPNPLHRHGEHLQSSAKTPPANQSRRKPTETDTPPPISAPAPTPRRVIKVRGYFRFRHPTAIRGAAPEPPAKPEGFCKFPPRIILSGCHWAEAGGKRSRRIPWSTSEHLVSNGVRRLARRPFFLLRLRSMTSIGIPNSPNPREWCDFYPLLPRRSRARRFETLPDRCDSGEM